MRLVIFHYHLRPGGVRRIIELATPHLIRAAGGAVRQVTLAGGEADDARWNAQFVQRCGGVPVEFFLEPAFGYFSEQRAGVPPLRARVRAGIERLLGNATAGDTIVWAHNLGIGRNVLVTRELARACERRGVPLLAHHHDWWFDNRWARWPELRRCGVISLARAAAEFFPSARHVRHLAINHADTAVLNRHLRTRARWLPNLTERAAPPAPARVRAAADWLQARLRDHGAPVWILPCRLLRRKNVAEALLLARWLRPEAWLVTTGGVSSADERAYAGKLEAAAHQHHWRLRLGVLAGDETGKPAIPELLAASECVVLTSIQEGFGLPYLEAAATGRPLIARAIANIALDLDRFGFRFPQCYGEIFVPPDLFDWPAEAQRQARMFARWQRQLPRVCRPLAGLPPVLRAAAGRPGPVPFSRLTLTAQLEVLARPAAETWERCAPLNPFLTTWRKRVIAGRLGVTPWPRGADQWLGGPAYARQWWEAATTASRRAPSPAASLATQADFLRWKLGAEQLFPLLWAAES